MTLLVGVPNRPVRFRVRLLGSHERFGVHWPSGARKSEGCYGPACKNCPSRVCCWYAVAAQQEERKVEERAASRYAVPKPPDLLTWPNERQRKWFKENRVEAAEPSVTVIQVPIVLTIIDETFAALRKELGDRPPRGAEVDFVRMRKGAAIKVHVVGQSQSELLADFSPLGALKRRYGPAIIHGIEALRASEELV